jgi:hypothetical protein
MDKKYISMNSNMTKALQVDDIKHFLNSDLQVDLLALANAKLVQIEKCFFLQPLIGKNFDAKKSLQTQDHTGLECFINHIHIKNVIGREQNTNILFTQGYIYANRLADNLRKFGNFKVIFSFSGEEFADSSVRFHLSRQDEPSWVTSDLESYEDECVMVIE